MLLKNFLIKKGEKMNKKIEIRKELSASAEMVYDAWLDPESVKKWMCPAEGVIVPNPHIEAKVGGKFQFDMQAGENSLPHFGEYRQLERPNKIQFTWNSFNTNNQDSLVTIVIESSGENSCFLTLTHEKLPTDESIKDHTNGWTRIMNCLADECKK